MLARAARFCLALTACALAPLAAYADTLCAGAGGSFATPCSALAAANAGDVIEVRSGTCSDSCAITVPRVTLRGVGGRPVIDLSGTDHPAEYEGIYVVRAAHVTLENLGLMGAHIAPTRARTPRRSGARRPASRCAAA